MHGSRGLFPLLEPRLIFDVANAVPFSDLPPADLRRAAGPPGAAQERRGERDVLVASFDPEDGLGATGASRGAISIVATGSGSVDGVLEGIAAGAGAISFRHAEACGASFAGLDWGPGGEPAVAAADWGSAVARTAFGPAGVHHGALATMRGPSALPSELLAGPNGEALLAYLTEVSATDDAARCRSGLGALESAYVHALHVEATAPAWSGVAAPILAAGAEIGPPTDPVSGPDPAKPRGRAGGAAPLWASVGTMARSLCASLLPGSDGDSRRRPGPRPSGRGQRARGWKCLL